MKNQVDLLDIINEKRKQYHELKMNIQICQAGMPEMGNTANMSNEQLKDLEILNMTIDKYKNELEELETEAVM